MTDEPKDHEIYLDAMHNKKYFKEPVSDLFKKHEYEVRVDYIKYEDQHPCFSFFKIMAKDYLDAEKEARKQMAEMIGGDIKYCKAFTIDKYKHSK